ncbi:MAG: helix-turn-helix transcriptional regulator, partial [Clostridia bacterium]|nr:helix-turn-helix transcriptional regulator [Clostridia bacterium]
ISVMDYLLSCRIAAAKNMLAKTDKSISEIVESCGFSDNSNFNRTFKKLNNMSPSEFRTKFKN